MSFVDEMKSTPRKTEIPMDYICKCIDAMLDEAAKVFVEHVKSEIRKIVKTENLRRIERNSPVKGGEINLSTLGRSHDSKYRESNLSVSRIIIRKFHNITDFDEKSEYKLPNFGYMSNYGEIMGFDNFVWSDSGHPSGGITVSYEGGHNFHVVIRLEYGVETSETGFVFKRKSTKVIPNEPMKSFSSKVSQLASQDGITSEFIATYDEYYGLCVKHYYVFQY